MEKLQAAIEKARAQREASRAVPPEAGSRRPEKPKGAASGKAVPDAEGDWLAFPEISLDAKRMLRKRVFLDSGSTEATHFDRLRTKVLQLCRDNGWTRVIITSPTQSCGKTTTCANLMASFARQKDRRVIALDLDMRRPGLGQLMGVQDRADLVSVFEDRSTFESSAMRIGENVIFATNAGPHRNPAQIMLQDRTKQIIDEIQARYSPDLILFDTPPLLSVDDTAALLKHVDCAMIVSAAEVSTIEQIDLCEKEVAEQTNVLGVILNRCQYIDETETYGY